MRYISTAILALMLLSFQNCSQSNFSMIDAEEKAAKVSTSSVFGEGNGEINATGSNAGGIGNIIGRGILSQLMQPSIDEVPAESEPIKPVKLRFMCSDDSSNLHSNLALATTLVIRITALESVNNVKCEISSTTLRNEIIEKRQLSLEVIQSNACNQLDDGMYQLLLIDPNSQGRATLMGSSTGLIPGGILVKKSGARWSSDALPSIISDFNGKIKGNGDPLMPEVPCDSNASPLVVHLNSDVEKAEPLVLTSQARGVLFDILGLNADPIAHSKKRISWHRSHQYYFIALPDKQGQVRGINELFGDNTLGPDGQFAHHGFHALSKFDGTSADGKVRLMKADGLITDADPIYEQLRLWQDRNFDGIAQPDELKTLSSVGLSAIDLKFDPNYKETDRYGNETLYKSVVLDRKGTLHLLFDVWFNPLEPGERALPSRGLASQ